MADDFKPKAMRDAFLENLLYEMEYDSDIFFLSADFGSPVLDKIRERFPERFINVGIAEQNLINVAAGLGLEGFKVFAYAIAPFITMRCFEQIRVNLALMHAVRKLNVNLVGVGAGYSYVVSGPTHQCYEDISLMRTLPNVEILSTSDHLSSAASVSYCLQNTNPKYIRLDAQVLPLVQNKTYEDLFFDGFRVLKEGRDVALISTGYCTQTAKKVAEQLEQAGKSCTVVDIVNISKFNSEKLLASVSECDFVFSLEEGFQGCAGLDTKLSQLFAATQHCFVGFGVANGYNFELGTREELHEQAGIGLNVLQSKIWKLIEG